MLSESLECHDKASSGSKRRRWRRWCGFGIGMLTFVVAPIALLVNLPQASSHPVVRDVGAPQLTAQDCDGIILADISPGLKNDPSETDRVMDITFHDAPVSPPCFDIDGRVSVSVDGITDKLKGNCNSAILLGQGNPDEEIDWLGLGGAVVDESKGETVTVFKRSAPLSNHWLIASFSTRVNDNYQINGETSAVATGGPLATAVEGSCTDVKGVTKIRITGARTGA
jgi:hypothetical protein